MDEERIRELEQQKEDLEKQRKEFLTDKTGEEISPRFFKDTVGSIDQEIKRIENEIFLEKAR
jgi:hypothetical protein